jgi:hypothetical protein
VAFSPRREYRATNGGLRTDVYELFSYLTTGVRGGLVLSLLVGATVGFIFNLDDGVTAFLVVIAVYQLILIKD